MCVVYLDLLYKLSAITNKAGYDYPSNTMYSYTTYAFVRFCQPSCNLVTLNEYHDATVSLIQVAEKSTHVH